MRIEQARAVSDSRSQFLEVTLLGDSIATGKKVAQILLPRDAVLISIRRGRDFLIPHGDTLLLAGDVITLLCKRESCDVAKNSLVEIKINTSKDDS